MRRSVYNGYDPGQLELYYGEGVANCRLCNTDLHEGDKLIDGLCRECFIESLENWLHKNPEGLAFELGCSVETL